MFHLLILGALAALTGEDQEFRYHLPGGCEGSARFQHDVRVSLPKMERKDGWRPSSGETPTKYLLQIF